MDQSVKDQSFENYVFPLLEKQASGEKTSIRSFSPNRYLSVSGESVSEWASEDYSRFVWKEE